MDWQNSKNYITFEAMDLTFVENEKDFTEAIFFPHKRNASKKRMVEAVNYSCKN